jgi:hypothetical protein
LTHILAWRLLLRFRVGRKPGSSDSVPPCMAELSALAQIRLSAALELHVAK